MVRVSEAEYIVGIMCLTYFKCHLPTMNISFKVTVSVWTFSCFSGSFCLNFFIICISLCMLMPDSLPEETKRVNLSVPYLALLNPFSLAVLA